MFFSSVEARIIFAHLNVPIVCVILEFARPRKRNRTRAIHWIEYMIGVILSVMRMTRITIAYSWMSVLIIEAPLSIVMHFERGVFSEA